MPWLYTSLYCLWKILTKDGNFQALVQLNVQQEFEDVSIAGPFYNLYKKNQLPFWAYCTPKNNFAEATNVEAVIMFCHGHLLSPSFFQLCERRYVRLLYVSAKRPGEYNHNNLSLFWGWSFHKFPDWPPGSLDDTILPPWFLLLNLLYFLEYWIKKKFNLAFRCFSYFALNTILSCNISRGSNINDLGTARFIGLVMG